MRIRVLVTMYAEVELNMIPHPDGQGAAINPVVEDKALVVNYSAHDVPERFDADARTAIATCAAAVMATMCTRRLEKRLGAHAEPVTFGGPTQAPGSA